MPKYCLIVLCFIVSCKQDTEVVSVDVGYNYFPHQVGATWEYRVDSLAYDDNTGETTIDTFTYWYKEIIASEYTDVSGKPAQLVQRYYRNADSLPWIRVANAGILVTELNAQKVEENIRFVKLLFPLSNDKTWNGNMFNILEKEEYRITGMDESQTIGGNQYAQTLTVLHRDELNAIEEIKQLEVYARNTGLVSLVSDSINTQVSGSRGFRYRLTLKSYIP